MSAWKCAVLAAAALASACSSGRTETKDVAPPVATPPPVAVSQPAAPAQPEPTAQPDAETAQRWAELGVASPSATTSDSGFPTMPPAQPVNMSPPSQASASDGLSETQALQEKIERYRSEYGLAKRKVDGLERQVRELEELVASVYAEGNSASATVDADVVRARLNRARGELEQARADLAAVEERARRDGVGYGQLY